SAPAVKRFGFMSQVSPDGRYVVTSIGPPAAENVHQKENPGFAPGLSDRLFSMNYNDIRFTQVFYPTRGILAWYDRKAQKLRPLPGADDPRFVQTSAFWSPDGKYLIFSRAEARDPYPAGAEKPKYANDPNETQVQYDLYKIPFNEGRGGKAEPVAGASGNGMSNSFPKVSPDGRWIVFVQAHNGQLMRPDSKLYIVPFAGGKARLMNCNTPLMNSWHTFSPNGRWLAFSSKARSPYTRLMLTHIDADGNDSPAIIVDNTTAAKTQEGYNLLRKAVDTAPDFPDGHNQLGTVLAKMDRMDEAVAQLQKAVSLASTSVEYQYNLGFVLMSRKDSAGAVPAFQKAVELSDGKDPRCLAALADAYEK